MKFLPVMKSNITKATLLLLLTFLTTAPAWAQLSGSGTESDPYLIQSDADWITFCDLNVHHHAFTLENADHFRLTADITATKYRSLDFAGEFDGNGHTITISYGNNKWPGLFYASAACLYIHDLKVKGTIFPAYSSAHNYGGAIICRILGSPTKLIENCIVSVDIRNNSSNTNTVIGGFVGECSQFETEDYDEGLTLRNCIFNGTTPRTGGHFNAGFVGYSNNESNYSALHLENCVYAPREVLVEPNYTFCPQYSSAEGIYYTSNATHNQGSRVYDNLPGGDVYTVIAVPFKNTFNYYYLPQNTVSYSGLEDSYPYTGSPVTISYTVINNGATLNTGDYTAVIKNAVGETVTTVTDMGDYQLQVTIGDVTYSHAFYVSGPLTQVEGVYQINSLADWMTLADDVAAGNSYSGASLRLNTDFTTDVMIGTESHKFSGTFDGNGHTIIFNKTATENYCAPFRYIENATISNLTIMGFATSTGKKMGGLVAYACGTNTISHCSVGATLTCNRTDDSDASNGGFVAHVENDGGSTTLTYCTFNGFLYGTKALCNGGFVGWGGTTVNLDHCLFNPVEMNMGSTESSTFARCETVNYNHAYYLRTFGATQGVKAYTSAQNALCDKQTMGDGNDYYILRSSSIEGLAVTYEYTSGSSISLGAYYVLYDGSTLDPSKYTVTIRNSSNTVVSVPAEVGRYKMTVSGNNSEGYYGSISKNFWVMRTLTTDEDGFALVGDMTDWNSLACLMESSRDIAGIKVKLTADIGTTEAPIRKMISDVETYAFNGIFDGDGHTLTINLWDKGPVGPFRYVGNATFVNTHVTGRIRGKDVWDSYLGGLVGKAAGIVNITACHSSVLMWDTGLGWAGGFIGSDLWSNANITITDCLFDGIYKNELGSAGGFVGRIGYMSHSTVTNCLNNGSLINNGGQIIIVDPIIGDRCNPSSYHTFTNCYHKFETPLASCNVFNLQHEDVDYTNKTGAELREQMGEGWTINDNNEVVPAMVTSYSRSITVADDIIHGTVTAPTSCISSGIVNLTVTPDENYSVVSVTYNDGNNHTIVQHNGIYSFTMPNANVTVSATFSLDPNAIPYMAYNTTTDRLEQCMHVSPTVVTESSTTLGTADNESWYIVNSDVTVEDRMTVNGTVHLILADNASLTSVAGITVHSGNTLNIYGQVEGTGAIIATVVDAGGNYAALGTEDNGGNNPKTLGTINIHGGHITATGGAWSAGIGGGVGGGSGTINIYGGTISAIGNNGDAQAIGRGSSGYPVTRSIVDGLCVYANNSNMPVSYNNRMGGLDQQIVRVEPCTEHNFVNNVCTYCGHYHHYELSYNANGATGGEVPPTAIILCDGDRIATVSDNVGELDRVGYTFAGWNTAADGSGTAYMPGDEFTISEMVTLYAQWNVITYLIGYTLDGGTLPEGQSNPVHYTIESGDITLVNPSKTGCYFMGWSGTGINGTLMSVTIPAGSSGHRSYTASWDDNNPPFAGMEIDHEFSAGEVGRFYVKMPAPEKPTGVWVYNEELGDYVEVMDPAEEDFPVRIDTIPDWFNTSFKVYDSGGKDEDYLYNTNDSHINTLILIAPEGKIFSVQGEQDDIRIQNYQSVDRLTIYDGATTTDPTLVNIDEEREQFDGMPFATTGNIIRFDLYTDDPDMPRDNGLNLTVTVTTPPANITLANDDSQSEQTNIGVIASNHGVFSNVTLEGRTLYKDGTWNTLCLPFDIEDIHSSLLRGATVKTLENTDFADGTLTMNFADASSIEAGKPYLLKWDIDLSYHVIEGTDGEYYNYFSPSNLFDGTRDEWLPVENDGAYCIFEASDGTMTVPGYTITTAGKNPQAWELYGKLNESDEWTLIDSRDATTTPADALPNSDGTDQYYSAANPGTYHYFRFTVIQGGEEEDGYAYFGLAELTLQGDFTPLNLVNPTFNYVTIKNELHPMTSNGVTFAGYYGTMATTGLLFDEHNLFGNALHANLSITDPEPIPGCSFNAWCEDAERTTPASTIPFDSATGNVTLYARYGLFVDVSGYGDSDGGWVFIASPVTNSLKPKEVGNLLGTKISEYPDPDLYDFDLYRFNQAGANSEWENYHQHTDQKDPTKPFRLENGQGYLYARKDNVSLYFAGAMNTANTKTMALVYEDGAQFAGYNLVGNPFTEAAYIDRTYYKMNTAGDNVEAVVNYAENTIPAYTGVIVKANGENENVTFTRASYTPEASTGNQGDLLITLSQTTEVTRGNSSETIMHDKAFVSFNEGTQLGKFVFNKNHAKLYIPQGGEDYAIANASRDGACTVSTTDVNFKAVENGTYTITVNPEGVEMVYLHLIDNITGTDIDLLVEPSYTFEGRISDYASRFKLVYSTKKNIEEIGDNEPFAFIHDGEIILKSDGIVQVIDMLGRVIRTVGLSQCGSRTIAGMTPGVYVLRLISGENVRTQKIVIK